MTSPKMKCPNPECRTEINLKYIRNFLQDKDISKSKLGQWIHDKFPNNFYWLDIDGISYKLATKTLRIIEYKEPEQELKSSQKAVLPLLAISIKYLIEQNAISEDSGVFILWGDSGWGAIHQILPQIGQNLNRLYEARTVLNEEQFNRFVSGLEFAKTTPAQSMPIDTKLESR